MATREVTFNLKATDNLSGALSGIAKSFDKLGKEMSSPVKNAITAFDDLGRSVGKIGLVASGAALAGVTALGAALAGFAGSGIKQAADLEKQMSGIAATLGKTKEEVQPLKDLITSLALDPNLTVNTTEAAAAIEMLAKNGLSMQQILDGAAAATVALANATGADFSLAADTATDVLAQFGIEAGNMTTAIDGLVGVTTSSKFTMEDMSLALAQAGGVAAGIGVSFADFTTTIAATSSSFASGSDAGTSFKTMLQRLANPTAEMQAVMDELGISLFDATGEMRPMGEVVGQLNTAFSGMTEAQRANTAAVLGGSDAARTLLALAGMTEAEFNALSGTVNASGQAFKAAAERVDNLKGAFDIFRGIVEAIQIQVGDKFLPILRSVTTTLTTMATNAAPAVVEFFGNAATGIQNLIDVGGQLFSTFQTEGAGGVMAALGFGPDAVELVTKITDSLTGLGSQLSSQIAPIFSDMGTSIMPTLNSILSFANQHWAELSGAIAGVIAVLAGATVFATTAATIAALSNPITLLIAAAAALGAAWAGNWFGIRDKTAAVWAVVQPIFTDLQTWLGQNIPAAIETLSGFWTNTLQPAIEGVWGFLSTNVLPLFSGELPDSLGIFGGTIERLKEGFSGFLTNLEPVIPAFQKLWEQIEPALPGLQTLAELIGGALLGAFLALAEGVGAVMPTLGTVFAGTITAMTETLGGLVTFVSGSVEMLVGLFTGDMDRARTGAEGVINGLVGAIVKPIETMVDTVGSVLETGIDKMIATFQYLYDQIVGHSIVPELIDSVVGYFTDLPGRLGDALTGIKNAITGAFEGAKSFLGGIFGGGQEIEGPQLAANAFTLDPAQLQEAIAAVQTSFAALVQAVNDFSQITLTDFATAWINATTVTNEQLLNLREQGLLPTTQQVQNIYMVELPALLTATTTTTNGMISALHSTLPAFASVITAIDQVKAALSSLGSLAASVGNQIADSMNDAADGIGNLIELVGEAAEAFEDMASAAREAAAAAREAGSSSGASGGLGFHGGIGLAGGIGLGLGLGWKVPGGYPNDSFGPLFLQSGEEILVTPAGMSIEQLIMSKLAGIVGQGGDYYDNREYHLEIHTASETEPIIQDFALLKAMS